MLGFCLVLLTKAKNKRVMVIDELFYDYLKFTNNKYHTRKTTKWILITTKGFLKIISTVNSPL